MIYITEHDGDDGLVYQAEIDVEHDDYGSLKANIMSCSTFDVDDKEVVLDISDIPLEVAEHLVGDALNKYDEADVVRFLESEYADLDNKYRRGG